MSLPACEQRVLDEIEAALQAGEPHLASMFATFTRLARDEGNPRTEELDSRPRRPWNRLRQPRVAGRRPSDARSTPAGRRTPGRPAGQLRTITLIVIVLAAAVSAALLGVNAKSAGSCGPASAAHNSARVFSRARICQAAAPASAQGRGR